MSAQRTGRHSQTAVVWRSEVTTDNRGNEVILPDADGPHAVRAAFIPQRSARAEVPGQQTIDVVKMIVAADLEGVTLWSRVDWRGETWDIVTPPSYHHGTRRTRHWAMNIRRRP